MKPPRTEAEVIAFHAKAHQILEGLKQQKRLPGDRYADIDRVSLSIMLARINERLDQIEANLSLFFPDDHG